MNVGYDYNLEDGVLSKNNLIEKKHLFWQFGGVPTVDKNIWDKYVSQIQLVRIRTDKGRIFEIPADVFNEYKKVIDFSYGSQYIVTKGMWTITNRPKPDYNQKSLGI